MAKNDVSVEIEGDDEAKPPKEEAPVKEAAKAPSSPPPKKGKKGKKPEPALVPKAQVRQKTVTEHHASVRAAAARNPDLKPRFRVERDHKTIGPRGITKLAAGSVVSESTHDLVQLAEEGALLTKL